ncbi:MAG TPA: MarR family winged helix-turn-helix transcriptional regulator [Gemmatimonadales bacterium]|jgi:DNA-binding MarR family transcriptional regulator
MTPDSFGSTLQALARAHRGRLSALLAPHGLHAGQELLLLAVWDAPGVRQSQLADHLGVERPTVTRMVQRLERAGMLERRRDPDDARAMLVFPSARSRLIESTVRRTWSLLDDELEAALGVHAAIWQRATASAAGTFGDPG